MAAISADQNPAAAAGPNAGRKAVVMLSASAAVATLAFVGAPWGAVAVVDALGIVVPGVTLLAQVVLSEDSEHKRALGMAALRYLDRRAMCKIRQGETVALKKGEHRSRRRNR
ncbi:hypothetical protein AB0M38_31365 [Streptomyces sp. NPDC051742]|uniref:hypothetical protein n=1 Tax=unclassified Streptomyces TaxID=2593676 RepID=UPI0034192F01